MSRTTKINRVKQLKEEWNRYRNIQINHLTLIRQDLKISTHHQAAI